MHVILVSKTKSLQVELVLPVLDFELKQFTESIYYNDHNYWHQEQDSTAWIELQLSTYSSAPP